MLLFFCYWWSLLCTHTDAGVIIIKIKKSSRHWSFGTVLTREVLSERFIFYWHFQAPPKAGIEKETFSSRSIINSWSLSGQWIVRVTKNCQHFLVLKLKTFAFCTISLVLLDKFWVLVGRLLYLVISHFADRFLYMKWCYNH